MTGLNLRLQVCNREGSCTFVKTSRPLKVDGTVVSISTDDVQDVVDAITRADDELQEDESEEWADNFDLTKLRKKNEQRQ